MEIKNTFLESSLNISVESTNIKEEGEPLYDLLINDDCYTLSVDEWEDIKAFIDDAIDFIESKQTK